MNKLCSRSLLAPSYQLFFLIHYILHVLQDNYLEEAIKMRNLLEEFHGKHGIRRPTILGVREHVFTGRFAVFALENCF